MKILILSTILAIGVTNVQAQEILPKIERPIKKKGPSRTKKYLLIGGAAIADFIATRITIGNGWASEANPIAGNGIFGQAAVTILGTVVMTETALYLENNNEFVGKAFTGFIVTAKGYACYEHGKIIWRHIHQKEQIIPVYKYAHSTHDIFYTGIIQSPYSDTKGPGWEHGVESPNGPIHEPDKKEAR